MTHEITGSAGDQPRAESRSAAPHSSLETFDFRRPHKFGRDHIASIEASHDVFVRRYAGALTHALRSVVTLELISTDQITYEDYVRSIPNPSILVPFSLDPLPGVVVFEMGTQMGLTVVDRLLGGPGESAPLRRPTELEAQLLLDVISKASDSITRSLQPLTEVSPQPTALETNPQFVQAAAGSDVVLLLTYQLVLNAAQRVEGIVSLCYPFLTLQPALDRLEDRHLWAEQNPLNQDSTDSDQPLALLVPELDIDVAVQLRPVNVGATELSALQPGDVIRLDHRVEEPAYGLVGGEAVLRGRLGSSSRRVAMQVASWESK